MKFINTNLTSPKHQTKKKTKKKTKKIYIINISNKNYTRHMYIPARVRALEH